MNKSSGRFSEQKRRFSCASLRARNFMMTWSLIKNRIFRSIYGTRTFELTWCFFCPGLSTIPPCGTRAGQCLMSRNRGETLRGQCSKSKRWTYYFFCTNRFYMIILKIVWKGFSWKIHLAKLRDICGTCPIFWIFESVKLLWTALQRPNDFSATYHRLCVGDYDDEHQFPWKTLGFTDWI